MPVTNPYALSPLEHLWVSRLIDVLINGGLKIYLTERGYRSFRDEGLPRHAVDAAINVAWRMELLDVRQAGRVLVIELRPERESIDRPGKRVASRARPPIARSRNAALPAPKGGTA